MLLKYFSNVHIDTKRAARLEATSHTYWTILTSSSSGTIPNFSRTLFVLLSPLSTESLDNISWNCKFVTNICRVNSWNLKFTYCSICDTRSEVRFPAVRRPCSVFSPINTSLSLVNLASITRTISPRYFPAMYFSNLRKKISMVHKNLLITDYCDLRNWPKCKSSCVK